MRKIDVCIDGADKTIPLYIIHTHFKYEEWLGYTEAYDKNGAYLGSFSLGRDILTFDAYEITESAFMTKIEPDGCLSIIKNDSPLRIRKMQYNCKDILVGYSPVFLNNDYSEERGVFEAFLQKMGDSKSIAWMEEVVIFDEIRQRYAFMRKKDIGYIYDNANCFIEVCISSERRCNIRRLSDRMALLNWDKIKNIEHNRLLLNSERKPTTKRMVSFLINRLNQRSSASYNDNQYKQLIQMKL